MDARSLGLWLAVTVLAIAALRYMYHEVQFTEQYVRIIAGAYR